MGPGGVLSYLCSFILVVYLLFLWGIGWMLGGLLGFYPCLLFVGFMGLVWMRVYL